MICMLTKKFEKLIAVFPPFVHLCRLYYRNIVKREISLGCICNRDRVLCIGGGPVPSTALEIALSTGAEVQVIDIDPEAVKTAKEVVCKLHLQDRVQVLEGAGQQIDVSSFSVIHVALQACPHDEIFQNIWSKSQDGTRILMRTPKEGLKHMYSVLPKKHCSSQCCQVGQKNLTMNATLLFTK